MYLFRKKRNMGRKRDRFWDYAVYLGGRFKCRFCERDFPGGVSRVKSHLSGLRGQDIAACNVVPLDVQKAACEAIQKRKEAYEATQWGAKRLNSASTSSGITDDIITSTSISTSVSTSVSVTQKEKTVAQVFFLVPILHIAVYL